MRQNSVDLFFATHDFHALAHSRAEMVPFAGSQIPILSATDLTVFKAKFGRDQDWVDIKEMLRAGTVDMAEALHWVELFLGRTKNYNDLIKASKVARESTTEKSTEFPVSDMARQTKHGRSLHHGLHP